MPPVPWPRTAFLGLGALGAPMATRLLAAGVPLTVHNRNRAREQPLRAAGARGGVDAAAAVRDAQRICLCLSDDDAVRTVLEAVAPALAPGSLVVDFSTIAPASSIALAAWLAERQVGYLDAPVTGGTEGARAGTLAVLIGGAAADVERARPLLQLLGSQLHHFGPVGSGQQVKALNQVLVAGSYAAVAEAMALGARLGLPLEQVCEALRHGAAGSWALEHRSDNMLREHYPPGFRLALHRKDLAIALAAARAAELELPVSQRVAAMEDELIASGHGDQDVSVLARWFQRPAPEAGDAG
ncbi:MAG: NAD(P)-dependent oxidoreductase [Synechococcus sp.]|nr:NAD(P)-dependent oxidoreductase [Synechococcus sp.]